VWNSCSASLKAGPSSGTARAFNPPGCDGEGSPESPVELIAVVCDQASVLVPSQPVQVALAPIHQIKSHSMRQRLSVS